MRERQGFPAPVSLTGAAPTAYEIAMRFGQVMLWLGAATFVGIGVLYLAQPELLNVYAGPPGPGQRTEIRAIYGGLEFGLGLFLGWAARARERVQTGLVLLGLVLTGITLGRIVGLVVEGTIDPVNLGAGIGEGAGALLAWWALRASGRAPEADSTPR